MVNEIGEANTCHYPRKETGMFHPLGGSEGFSLGLGGGSLLFKQCGVNRNNVLFGIHECIGYDDGNHHDKNNDDVMIIEYSLRDGHRRSQDTIGSLDKGFAGRGHGEGDRAGKTRMPHDKAAIGRSNEQSVVDRRHLTGNFFGENNTHNKAKTPVEPACHSRDGSNESYGCDRGLGDGSQKTNAFLDNRSGGQGRTAYQN